MNELKVSGLTKHYGEKIALSDFSYTFTDGVYGILGPNGAGKSTLLNILTDNVHPDAGEIYFNGINREEQMVKYRSAIGFMPQQQPLYSSMTLERFMFYMAALKGMDRKSASKQIDELLETVNLQHERHMRMGGFSGGMKQRALIAQAVLGKPAILILDEPTAGLDPKERINIRNLISELAFDRIVMIATHVVPDIEMIAKETLFLQEGRIRLFGDASNVCNLVADKVFNIEVPLDSWKTVAEKYKVSSMNREGEKVVLRVVSDEQPTEQHKSIYPSLEDLYLYMYK